MAEVEPEEILINRISMEGTQASAELNQIIIGEYAEAYEEGIELPAIDVYFDEETYWLADGFHRLKAVQHIGRESIAAKVYPGGQREAILHAVGANETHGLRRTNADRRHAVCILLTDPEWNAWANTEIARRCNVSEFLVRTIRSELTPAEEVERVQETTRKVRREGKTFDQNVTRIGKSRPQKKAAAEAVADEGLQSHGEASQATTLSSIKSKMDDDTTDEQSTQEPEASLTVPNVPTEAADQEPVVTHDTPPEAPPTAETRPDPGATTLPVEIAEQYSVEDAWAWAGRVEREVFVGEHRSELQRILKKIDRQKAAP
jgi:hypothetical protein